MILQVIWPSLSISPDFAETKLMGRRGIFMLAIACLASSSMMSLTVPERGVVGLDYLSSLLVCFVRVSLDGYYERL
jgi:hypothetical protein